MTTRPTALLACLCLCLADGPLLAETSDIGRELNQIEDQHTKAVAAALEPITRRYQVALAQLLKRATQTNDLDAALKIKERLAAIDASAVSPSTGKPRYTAETLHQLLYISEWSWSAKPEAPQGNVTRVSFTRDGQFLMAGKPTSLFKVMSPTMVQLGKSVLKFSDDYKTFEIAAWTDGTPRYGHRLN